MIQSLHQRRQWRSSTSWWWWSAHWDCTWYVTVPLFLYIDQMRISKPIPVNAQYQGSMPGSADFKENDQEFDEKPAVICTDCDGRQYGMEMQIIHLAEDDQEIGIMEWQWWYSYFVRWWNIEWQRRHWVKRENKIWSGNQRGIPIGIRMDTESNFTMYQIRKMNRIWKWIQKGMRSIEVTFEWILKGKRISFWKIFRPNCRWRKQKKRWR